MWAIYKILSSIQLLSATRNLNLLPTSTRYQHVSYYLTQKVTWPLDLKEMTLSKAKIVTKRACFKLHNGKRIRVCLSSLEKLCRFTISLLDWQCLCMVRLVCICVRVCNIPPLQPVAHRSVSLHRARTKWLPVQKISSPQIVSIRRGC